MDAIQDLASLDECVAPLADEDRRALRRYWEQVIREEWVPPAKRAPRPVPLAEDGRRERREARRAVATVVRLAARHPATEAPLTGPEAA